MAIYKQQNGTIEAIQFTGANAGEIYAFLGLSQTADDSAPDYVHFKNADGVTLTAEINDYIAKDGLGNVYPIKPDALALRYGIS